MCQRERAGCPRLRRHSAGRGCRRCILCVVRAAPLSSRPRHLSPLPPPSPSTPPPAPPDSPHAATPPPASHPRRRHPAPSARAHRTRPCRRLARRQGNRGRAGAAPPLVARRPRLARDRRLTVRASRHGDDTRRAGRSPLEAASPSLAPQSAGGARLAARAKTVVRRPTIGRAHHSASACAEFSLRPLASAIVVEGVTIDVEETTDAPKTPSPCFTSAPPAGRERRVYCGKYRHGKYKREYAPTHTCDMPEKLPETKTARAGSPRRSSRAVERRCVARSSRPRHPSLPNLLPARRRELELRPRPLGVEHRVRPALRRPSAASRALLRSRLALPIRVLKLGLNHGDLLRDPLHPQLMLPLQLYPLLVQLIQPHKQSGLRAVRQRHRLQDAVVLRSKF